MEKYKHYIKHKKTFQKGEVICDSGDGYDIRTVYYVLKEFNLIKELENHYKKTKKRISGLDYLIQQKFIEPISDEFVFNLTGLDFSVKEHIVKEKHKQDMEIFNCNHCEKDSTFDDLEKNDYKCLFCGISIG